MAVDAVNEPYEPYEPSGTPAAREKEDELNPIEKSRGISLSGNKGGAPKAHKGS